jgi:Cu+-exporting ATPase
MFKDPVCNMMDDEKTGKHVSEIEGDRTYFCSATCKSEFVLTKGIITRVTAKAANAVVQIKIWPLIAASYDITYLIK